MAQQERITIAIINETQPDSNLLLPQGCQMPINDILTKICLTSLTESLLTDLTRRSLTPNPLNAEIQTSEPTSLCFHPTPYYCSTCNQSNLCPLNQATQHGIGNPTTKANATAVLTIQPSNVILGRIDPRCPSNSQWIKQGVSVIADDGDNLEIQISDTMPHCENCHFYNCAIKSPLG